MYTALFKDLFEKIFFQLYMIPEIRTGILGVDMGPVDSEEDQLDIEEKMDKDVRSNVLRIFLFIVAWN